LVLGACLFAVYSYRTADRQADPQNRIVVDREQLLAFIAYRTRTAQGPRPEDILDNLPEDALQKLIDEYVEEEALYREALALGLDKSDYMLRRRLIRQLEFINQGLITSTMDLSEEDLQNHLENNKDRYYVPAKITFTHVFLNREKHGDRDARRLAEQELKALNRSKVPFHKALSHGDRFLYHRNYVGKNRDEVASHFGPELPEALFGLSPDDSRWHGPYQSPYGYHLVMLTRRVEGYDPTLEEIRERLEQDVMQFRLKQEMSRISQSIVKGYEAVVAEGIQRSGSAKTDQAGSTN